MYQTLLSTHNGVRWVVLFFLLLSLVRACRGLLGEKPFTGFDNGLRHWTATAAHIQLMIGMLLYFQSPITKYFWANRRTATVAGDLTFFSLIHLLLMLAAVVVLTIGSAKAKRKATDTEKFQAMLVWFSVALLLIFIAIPWPFSPFAHRPYFR